MTSIRSLLFSPGSSSRMMEKAKDSGADALIFDLEDAVAADVRGEARAYVSSALSQPSDPAMFVRVNHPSTGEMEDDLAAVVGPHLRGLILPKAEGRDEVARLDDAVSMREERNGLSPGSISLLPLIESGRGLHFAYDIACASRRILGLAFSSGEEGDFMADIDAEWTPGAPAMLYPRSKVVCETRAAGLHWPVDGVFMRLTDDAAFARDCRLSRSLGFQGRMAIHPKQIPVIHEIFTPSAEEVARQEAVLAVYRQAEADGLGAVQHEGVMIDKANAVRAERILARARRSDGSAVAGQGAAR